VGVIECVCKCRVCVTVYVIECVCECAERVCEYFSGFNRKRMKTKKLKELELKRSLEKKGRKE